MAYGNDGLGAVQRGGKRPGAAAWKGRKPLSGAPKSRPAGGARLFKRPAGAGAKPEGARLFKRPGAGGVTMEGARVARRVLARKGVALGDDGVLALPSRGPSFTPNFFGIGADDEGLGGLFSKKKKAAPAPSGPAPVDVRARGQTFTAPTLNYAVDKKGIARDLTTGQSISGAEVTRRAQAFSAETGQAVAAAKKVKKNIFQKIGGTVSQAAKNIAKNPLKNLVLPVVGAAVAGVAVTKGVKAIKAASAAKKLAGAAKTATDVATKAAKGKSKLDLVKKAGGVGLTIAGIAARGKAAKSNAGIEPFAQIPIESAIPGAEPVPEALAPVVEAATGVEVAGAGGKRRRRQPVNVAPGSDTLPPPEAYPGAGSVGPSIQPAEPTVASRIEDLIAQIAPKAPERASNIASTATDLATSPSMFRDAGLSYGGGGGGGGGGFFSGGSLSPSPSATDAAAQAQDDTIFGMPKMVAIGVGLAGIAWFATRKRRKGA